MGAASEVCFRDPRTGPPDLTLIESKSVAMDRLRKEGRWEEASLWRDQKRKELREEGQTRAEANEAAWQAMSEQFPPLQESGDQPADPSIQLLDINPEDYDGHPDMSRDILWVYENLALSGITAKVVPRHRADIRDGTRFRQSYEIVTTS